MCVPIAKSPLDAYRGRGKHNITKKRKPFKPVLIKPSRIPLMEGMMFPSTIKLDIPDIDFCGNAK